MRLPQLFAVVCSLCGVVNAATEAFPQFKEHVINPDAEVVYAVAVADMNRDAKPDIIGLSATYVAWYENPGWQQHRIVEQLEKDNVCVAAQDINGDGAPELAIGADWQFNNTDSGGALYIAQSQGDPAKPWKVTRLLNRVPTLHRIRWMDLEGIGKYVLVVAPLKGVGSTAPEFRDKAARLFLLRPPSNPATAPWPDETIGESLHLMHNLFPYRSGSAKADIILVASAEGITRFEKDEEGQWSSVNLTSVLTGAPAIRGAGEIKVTAAQPATFATIEPWHGNEVVVYTKEKTGAADAGAYVRHVLDDTIKGGHAIDWADFDKDGKDDLLAGYREKAGPKDTVGLNVYTLRYDAASSKLSSEKHSIDEGGMATEDACAADINGDGWPDIVAGGRSTHNIKLYENLGGAR